jgi:tRNA wybutosine-synthesizing protein 4
MENSDSSKVLKFLTEFITSNIAIIVFEMINPTDPFGMTMIENLEARGCQLLGLKDVRDEEAQVSRMIDSGFKNAHCESMLKIHNSKLNDTERTRIERLEMFDEFEEWELIQTHYCICVGSKFSDDTELTF